MSGIPYRTNDHPPYPALRIALSRGGEEQRCYGKIDTGASYTCVPQRLLDAVNAVVFDEVRIRGFDGKPQVTYTYYVSIEIVDANWPDGAANQFDSIEVCAIEEPEDSSFTEVLVGRDLLRNWALLLEGPRDMLHVQV
jgi:hypothetical protein